MFKKISPDCVVSDDGFSVELVDKTPPSAHTYLVKYTEGNRVMAIEIEGGPNDFAVYTETMRCWLPPHEGELITKEKMEEIRTRVDAALTFLGLPHVMG